MGAVELWGTSGDGTRYLYDDSKVHIWREMTANLEPDIYPKVARWSRHGLDL